MTTFRGLVGLKSSDVTTTFAEAGLRFVCAWMKSIRYVTVAGRLALYFWIIRPFWNRTIDGRPMMPKSVFRPGN